MIENNETFVYYQDDIIDSPEILQKLLDIKQTKHHTTNLTLPWESHLIPDGVGEVKIWVLDSKEHDEILSYLCTRVAKVFEQLRSNKYTFQFQIAEWQPGSFITWHTDVNHLCAVTCYLDNNTEFGGEIMVKPFEDQSMGVFLEPKVNRGVLIKGVYHCVSKIHRGTRTSLQIWASELDNANV